MQQRTKIYTVYECPEKPDAADRVELVQEGFSFAAFLLHVLWLLYQRLWIPALAYVALLAGLGYAGEQIGISRISMAALQLLLQLMLGYVAYDLQRWRLTRRGYRFTGVVAAESVLNAQRRYYDAVA